MAGGSSRGTTGSLSDVPGFWELVQGGYRRVACSHLAGTGSAAQPGTGSDPHQDMQQITPGLLSNYAGGRGHAAGLLRAPHRSAEFRGGIYQCDGTSIAHTLPVAHHFRGGRTTRPHTGKQGAASGISSGSMAGLLWTSDVFSAAQLGRRLDSRPVDRQLFSTPGAVLLAPLSLISEHWPAHGVSDQAQTVAVSLIQAACHSNSFPTHAQVG